MRKKPDQNHQPCVDAAFRYLGCRPRSGHELRTHLKRKGYDTEAIDDAFSKLGQQGLLDDLAFAEFWKTNREAFRPRSRARLRSELRQKGVAADIIAQVIEQVDDEESAYRAVQKAATRLGEVDDEEFRRRLGVLLRGRGFGYEVAHHVIARLWEEIHQDVQRPS